MNIVCKLAPAMVVVAIATTGCAHLPLLGTPHTATSSSAVVDAQYTFIQEPEAGYASIPKLIEGARKSVRMTMYALNDPAIEQALITAHTGHGVTTKVVLDRAYHGQLANQSAYDRLESAGLGVRWAPAGTIAHEKALVIDDSAAVISTANFDAHFYRTGRDALVVTTDPAQVSAIAATVDGDYDAARKGRLSAAEDAAGLVWSPAARSVFLQTIDSATSSLDVTSEEFQDRAVAAAVAHAAANGVQCRIVLNADARGTQPVAAAQRAGCSAHVLPQTTDGLYMHEKIVLADRKSLLIGSHNLSTASLLENRELSLQLDTSVAPNIIAAVASQFDKDFARGVDA